MRVTHWSSKNGSGMHRMAEDISNAEKTLGVDSVCLDGNDPKEIPQGMEADIHVVHTHLPDDLDDRKIKKVFIPHGTPEVCFRSSLIEGIRPAHGAADSLMVTLHMLHTSDAVVTFWPRHQAIWQSMVDKKSIVHCIPMGIDTVKFSPRKSEGKWNGVPSLLTAENCSEIKWPLDLVIAMPWVMQEMRTLRFHFIYMPLDQSRWWTALAYANGSAYRSHISSSSFSHDQLINAFCSVDYYVSPVRYGDFNRVCLEAKASGCKVISFTGNPHADYWIPEGDQRVIAAEMLKILRSEVSPRETLPVASSVDTAKAMIQIYERLLNEKSDERKD